METESEFAKQFAGSASANVVFVFFGILYLLVKRICDRNTKCKSRCHTCCLDIDVSDRTIREPPILEV